MSHGAPQYHKDEVVRDLSSETNNTLENGPVMHNMIATKADVGHSTSRCGGSEQCKDNTQTGVHVKDKKAVGELVCLQCLHGSELICCFGKGCQRRYHPSCLNPPLNYYPVGFWNCAWCVKKKLDLGAYSISEGVESILDSREGISKNNVTEKEYFVKYLGLAHAHNRWIPETQMLEEGPKVLSAFKRKRRVIKWKKEWSIPHRLLLKRAIVLPKQNKEHLDGHDNNYSVGCFEWLVKWSGLGYDHITWELDSASFLTSSEGIKLKNDYESRRLRKGMDGDVNEERKASFAELPVPPSGNSVAVSSQHLSYVNKLCMCWHKGQSAVIVDDKIDQERVMKVMSFILSLHCKVTRPFLIVSTSAALAVWEREFLHLAPSANLVIYKGNKDVRRSIRTLEFYNDDNGILFQILLSSPDIIVEDLKELRCISWEAIIVDECQRPRILEHLDNIKILTTKLRLLVVSGQIKDDRADYVKMLSFLNSENHVLNTTETEPLVSDSISNLKSKLDQYVAFRTKTGSTRFAEFWVPAKLSSLQLEQYCSLLLSDRTLLCSAQKSDKVNALRSLLNSTRKCCNHPFLLDSSLYNSINKGLSVEEQLNIGIKASGKLQLLEKILLKARSRGLRVMILFQKNVKALGARLLEHILEYFNVNWRDVSTMQAFELSVCWLAASLLKHNFDKQGSLALAKVHLNFNCEEEEVTYVYSKLLKFKKEFSSCLQSGICVEKCTSDCETPGLTDLVEDMQNGFHGPLESDTYRHDLQRESPTTVLATHYQTCAENLKIRLTDIGSCPQKSSGTFPAKAYAIPVTSKAAFLEHQSEVFDSSDDPCNVNPATGSLENQINGDDSEVSLINNNEVVETITCSTADVPEVNQHYSEVSAVHGESIMDFPETTFPYMEPSNTDLLPLPQEDVTSFLENISIGEVLPFDEIFYENYNLHEAEPTLQVPDDPPESVPDPLQIEMERIKKATEEANRIRQQKLHQLESDHGMEVKELVAKYQMLLQSISTEVALQKKELDAYYKTVQKNKLLASVLDHNHKEYKREAVLFAEQGLPSAMGTPSSSSTQQREHHPPLMPDQRLEQCLPMIPPHLFTPTEAVNALEIAKTSTAIPEMSPVRECIDPMIQSYVNLNYGCYSVASNPPLEASNSVPIMPSLTSGIPEQQLPLHLPQWQYQ
ncbi:uncharacterized protein LOC107648625 isoform X3 [Arachis ipaensis]|uniref:uncharacterized protein LOC107648625 isoform X3 n=1 Tax=Arachis ipaensis TaxID=130454 RepID=UPI000A2B5F8E|nr:uncharacterized protein LOC107648625 isoform X3 [Arachis ipaensis]XP_020960077.1 uncharacterized protein LOC107648625 isoform X3 [Arachis ipaensis]XP_020960078.1 uncharacterized protein LOC107648625 isoform X3 [Arachis ipaensis]XP_025663812.1 uncharacterized protein LOC112759205 isoform X5 [Arachis hypogaea]